MVNNAKIILRFFFMLIFIAAATLDAIGQVERRPVTNPPVKSNVSTADQELVIKKILSGYNPAKLTSQDAQAIQEKFRAAGIHAGPENDAILKAAGFDPQKLRTLAPPPSDPEKGGPQPPSLDERLKIIREKICKPLGLTAAQSEKISGAFADFYAEMDKLTGTTGSNRNIPDKARVESLEKERDKKINQVITGALFLKYLELEKSARPVRPSPAGKEKQ